MKLTTQIFICFSVLFVSAQASEAHDTTHNWLLDKAGYASTKFYQPKSAFTADMLNDQFVSLLTASEIEIDQVLFKEKLRMFSGDLEISPGVRLSKRCKLDQLTPTVDFLINEYQAMGYEAQAQKVGRRYLNFVSVKPGSSPDAKIIVVSSHIDSVCNAGANDNGSGTIAALLIARALQDMSFKNTIYFVGFDNEESGMAGSRHFAKEMSEKYQDRFLGNINLEMMATNSRRDSVFHVIDCERDDSNFITDLFAKNISAQNIDLRINEACTRASDHSSFWRNNLPAVVVSENFFGGDSDRCYHRKCDVVDSRMDFEYMAKITKASALTVMDLAKR